MSNPDSRPPRWTRCNEACVATELLSSEVSAERKARDATLQRPWPQGRGRGGGDFGGPVAPQLFSGTLFHSFFWWLLH